MNERFLEFLSRVICVGAHSMVSTATRSEALTVDRERPEQIIHWVGYAVRMWATPSSELDTVRVPSHQRRARGCDSSKVSVRAFPRPRVNRVYDCERTHHVPSLRIARWGNWEGIGGDVRRSPCFWVSGIVRG